MDATVPRPLKIPRRNPRRSFRLGPGARFFLRRRDHDLQWKSQLHHIVNKNFKIIDALCAASCSANRISLLRKTVV